MDMKVGLTPERTLQVAQTPEVHNYAQNTTYCSEENVAVCSSLFLFALLDLGVRHGREVLGRPPARQQWSTLIVRFSSS